MAQHDAYDAIVVGARCAGATTALLLARKGYRVLLVDRAAFPSDLPNGHVIHSRGPGLLHKWGLKDAIQSIAPPLTTYLSDQGDFPMLCTNIELDGVPWGYAPRRYAFDQMLIEAAIDSGVEFRDRFNVESYLSSEGRIVGVSARGRSGPIEEHGHIVIGADGRNSRLARTVGAPIYKPQAPLTFYYFSYWSGVEASGIEVYRRTEPRHVIFACLSTASLFSVFASWSRDQLDEVRGDVESAFLAAADRSGDLGVRLRDGHREERFYGATDLPNFCRKPFGPGWALVGDAGLCKDPYRALGMGDALRDAEFLVNALDHGFVTGAMDDALAAYQTERDRASEVEYDANITSARFLPMSEEAARLRLAVRDDQELRRLYILAQDGRISQEQLLTAIAGQARL